MVLFGAEYWGGLVKWLQDTVLGEGKIAEPELAIFTVTDDPAEVVPIIRAALKRKGP